jgi:SAM-dependent methyltransferase
VALNLRDRARNDAVSARLLLVSVRNDLQRVAGRLSAVTSRESETGRLPDVTFISGGRPRFLYFDAQLGRPSWPSLRVLDFGGNAGNLLGDPQCTIGHENYWSVDVSRDAVILGRKRFPDAHFIFYDRFHPLFNPEGDQDAALPELGTFDLILAYSVITHLSLTETDELWTGLRRMLRPGGRFAFTFIDPHWRPAPRSRTNLEWRLAGAAPSAGAYDIVAVVDGELTDADRYPARAAQYDVLHSCDFVRGLFPDASVARPVFYERQHCAVIR